MRFPFILFNEGEPAGAGGAGASTTTLPGGNNGNVDIKALTDKVNALENNSKKLVEEKRELETQLKSIKDADLIAKGETQKLLDERTKELDELKPKLEQATARLSEIEAQEAKEKEDLINELPTDELKEIAQDLSLPKVRKLVKANAKGSAVKVDSGSAAQATTLTDQQKKEAREMFPFIPVEKAYEHYAHVKLKPKEKKD